MDWARVASDFKWDGSLRDIYIQNTTIEDWRKILELLQWQKPSFRVRGREAEIPDNLAEIFSDERYIGAQLSFEFIDMTFYCHFFQVDEFEMDFDPRGIRQTEDIEGVMEMMADLGRATCKPVILTAENVKSAIIFRYAPETDTVSWVPPNIENSA
jgi:hypothetical protein